MVGFPTPKAPSIGGGGSGGRNYGVTSPAAATPKQPPTYVAGASPPSSPSGGGVLGMFGPPKDPQKFGPRKSITRQDLGSVVGRRGPGISQVAGGDQDLHSVGRYGKTAPGGGGLSGLGGGF
jgi:hypothetical protein